MEFFTTSFVAIIDIGKPVNVCFQSLTRIFQTLFSLFRLRLETILMFLFKKTSIKLCQPCSYFQLFLLETEEKESLDVKKPKIFIRPKKYLNP